MRFNTALLHQVEKGDKETGATLTPDLSFQCFLPVFGRTA